ncbi:MAG TPA: hypothetical protein VMT51_04755, partial [Dongiaceae bacterium]|nr:hypothetical protein [Dongiaceae bacterium]
CLFFLFVAVACGQEADNAHKRLTNHDVIELSKLGLSDEVIIEKIRAASAAGGNSLSFDTSVEGLKGLKEAGVSDAVIKAMINPVAAPAPTVVAGAMPMTLDPNLPPPEVGVYWKDGTKFVRVDGQAVTNTKAGGRAGSIFTNGLRNQHWDATIAGPISKNVVRERRPVFYFYVPDGADSSDFVLISLNKKSDHREFQIGSFGGITGGKSGVKQDKEYPFHAEHVGIRMYKATLDMDLKPGEYAFFMGTGQGNTMAGANGGNRSGGAASGRVYDFSISE